MTKRITSGADRSAAEGTSLPLRPVHYCQVIVGAHTLPSAITISNEKKTGKWRGSLTPAISFLQVVRGIMDSSTERLSTCSRTKATLRSPPVLIPPGEG